MTAEAMSSSRILVTWGPVTEHEQNGNILGYKVRICFVFVFSVYFFLCANKNSRLLRWDVVLRCVLKEPVAQLNKHFGGELRFKHARSTRQALKPGCV